MTRHAAKIVLLFALVGTVSMAWAQGAWVMEPGKGIGPLKLEMTPKEIGAHVKLSDDIGFFKKYGSTADSENIVVQYAAGRAVLISLHRKAINTNSGAVSWTPHRGIGIGTPWNVAESTLGRNYQSRQLKTAKGHPAEFYYAYRSEGMGFRTKAGTIVQVDVFTPAY